MRSAAQQSTRRDAVCEHMPVARRPARAARREALDLILGDPERVLAESFESLAERSRQLGADHHAHGAATSASPGLREFKLALAQELAVGGSPLHRRVRSTTSTEQVVSQGDEQRGGRGQRRARRSSTRVAGGGGRCDRRRDARRLLGRRRHVAASWRPTCRPGCSASGLTVEQLTSTSTCSWCRRPRRRRSGVAFAISHVGGMPSLLEAVGRGALAGRDGDRPDAAGHAAGRRPTSCWRCQVPDDPVMHVGTEAYLAHLTVIEILTRAGGAAPAATRRCSACSACARCLPTHGHDMRHHPVLDWDERGRRRSPRRR